MTFLSKLRSWFTKCPQLGCPGHLKAVPGWNKEQCDTCGYMEKI